ELFFRSSSVARLATDLPVHMQYAFNCSSDATEFSDIARCFRAQLRTKLLMKSSRALPAEASGKLEGGNKTSCATARTGIPTPITAKVARRVPNPPTKAFLAPSFRKLAKATNTKIKKGSTERRPIQYASTSRLNEPNW